MTFCDTRSKIGILNYGITVDVAEEKLILTRLEK